MTHLKPGDKAPSFSGLNENGEKVLLNDFKGKKLILFFYPKDNTPTCTVEACNLRDNYSMLQEKGFELLGVSPDTQKKHQNFIKKFDFPFIIAIKGKNKDEILNYFRERIKNSSDEEFLEAKKQVKKIATFRLEEIIK